MKVIKATAVCENCEVTFGYVALEGEPEPVRCGDCEEWYQLADEPADERGGDFDNWW